MGGPTSEEKARESAIKLADDTVARIRTLGHGYATLAVESSAIAPVLVCCTSPIKVGGIAVHCARSVTSHALIVGAPPVTALPPLSTRTTWGMPESATPDDDAVGCRRKSSPTADPTITLNGADCTRITSGLPTRNTLNSMMKPNPAAPTVKSENRARPLVVETEVVPERRATDAGSRRREFAEVNNEAVTVIPASLVKLLLPAS
mmetsp:Transcript_3473/g.5036  ORF Transcript_3473/g.5036 Transcript_3473/m.5036 type:complete len:205 (-) Transcript_3473:191-805(-)